MKRHRDLGITQKSAWFMAHRIREAMMGGSGGFFGPAEAGESDFGGKRKNMSNAKRKELAGAGRGAVGKAAAAGVKDRDSNKAAARVMEATDAGALQGFVRDNVRPGATRCTNEARACKGMPEYDHEAVNRSVAEYVRGQAHTNGVESFRAMLERSYRGAFRKLSHKRLQRYVNECAGRRNLRETGTADMMAAGRVGKRLLYSDSIADNGPPSGARP